ncbi:hypothetical protein GGR53DRAFT_471414 [Hypoxylon sp. FL1150]|nr:hypothetical protein GGR53DRAFT_471414 [Hypoxylon sp. FL1150]
MRLVPSGPGELSRQVLHGDIRIKSEYFPLGTIVGTVAWANSRSQLIYGDPEMFRPERRTKTWRERDQTFVTSPLDQATRTLPRLDVRRTPKSTLGGDSEELGWGSRDSRQQQVIDNILEDQINLEQTSSHSYSISYHNVWTVGYIDFDKIQAHTPDEHWIPAHLTSELVPFSRRILLLKPRDRPPVGVNDAWNSFVPDERIRNSYLPLMANSFPSMSDTLLRNGGLFDANKSFNQIKEWAEEHPGVPCELFNSRRDVLRATIFNNTITLDIEFKRRLPKEGVQRTFTRVTTRLLDAGRMGVDIVICDPKMKILCLARQAILVLEAKRKFGARKENQPFK